MNHTPTQIKTMLQERFPNLSENKADELLAYIKGGPKPDWYDDDQREVPDPPEVPTPREKDEEDSSTYPMEIELSDEDVVAAIGKLIQGRDPEQVADIFQMAFERVPGVELGSEEEEELPPSPYSGAAIARRNAQLGMDDDERMGFEESLQIDLQTLRRIITEEAIALESEEQHLERKTQKLSEFGGLASALGALREPPEPPLENQADSIIQDKALQYFVDLGLEEKVAQVMVDNVAISDLTTVLQKIPKIDTAAEGDDELNEMYPRRRVSSTRSNVAGPVDPKRKLKYGEKCPPDYKLGLTDYCEKIGARPKDIQNAINDIENPNRSGGYGGLEEQETHRCSIGTGEGRWDRSIKSAADCKALGGEWVELDTFLGKFRKAREET